MTVSGTRFPTLAFPCALALRVPFGFRDLPRSGPVLRSCCCLKQLPSLLCVHSHSPASLQEQPGLGSLPRVVNLAGQVCVCGVISAQDSGIYSRELVLLGTGVWFSGRQSACLASPRPCLLSGTAFPPSPPKKRLTMRNEYCG